LFSKTLNIFLPLLFLSGMIYAQADSLESEVPAAVCVTPFILIAAGSAISGSAFEKDIQAELSDPGMDIDDYIALSPATGVYLFDLFGVKAENTFFDRIKYMAAANLASQAVVQSLKYSTDKLRPDGNDRLSFPSNHTNIAFTNAMIMWHEYRHSNTFAAYSGFVLAAGTGALRMVHDKHWTGDVLAGAGIGMLCANLIYRFRPLENWRPFGQEEKKAALMPSYNTDSFGITLILEF